MTALLLKIFVKDYKNTKSPKVRESYGILGSIVCIIVNILLSVGKYIIGTITNSVSITADSANNLSDAASNFITLISFKLSGRKPDREHPFGHGRIEYLASLIVGFFVELMGYELIKTSIGKIRHPEAIAFSVPAVIVLTASILAKIWMGLFNKNLGKRIDSPAMIAVAADSMSDTAATTITLVSLILSKFTSLPLDGYMGLLVSAFIIKSGFDILKESISILLGEPPKKELVDELVEYVLSFDGILGIHDLVIHSYGASNTFGSIHTEVSCESDFVACHETADLIEKNVKEKFGIELVVHLDPIITNDERINELKNKVYDIIKKIDSTLSMHDFRVVEGKNRTNLIFDVVKPYEMKLSDDELFSLIQKNVKALDSKFEIVLNFDNDYIGV